MQTAILASAVIQSIISKNEIVRGRNGVVYGSVGRTGIQFYHALRYLMPTCSVHMETVYEGPHAMQAADAYVRIVGAMEAHNDAVKHNIAKSKALNIRPKSNV